MKIIKLPKGVPPRKAKHGLTHFLRVPFATSISTPLLQKSILEIARDPIAAALPQIAWNNPSQVHFTITALSLKKPDRVNAAAQLLQGLDMNQIADQKNRSMQPATQDTTIRDQETLASGQAPAVALQGLQDPQRTVHYPHATRELRCYVKEYGPFLAHFRSLVCLEFEKAEFVPVAPMKPSSIVACTLMDIRYLRTIVWRSDPAVRGKERRLQPNFDASDLHLKYENFPWTTYFPLEKLCISEIGLKDFLQEGKVVGTGYRDIACVPLPGAPAIPSVGGRIDGYTRAAITMQKNSPVTPLLIPSTPPLPRS